MTRLEKRRSSLRCGREPVDKTRMSKTNATFLRARDPITQARGSDILHILKTATIENQDRYTVWLDAFNRLAALIAEQERDAAAVEAARQTGRAGGVFRAVKA